MDSETFFENNFFRRIVCDLLFVENIFEFSRVKIAYLVVCHAAYFADYSFFPNFNGNICRVSSICFAVVFADW